MPHRPPNDAEMSIQRDSMSASVPAPSRLPPCQGAAPGQSWQGAKLGSSLLTVIHSTSAAPGTGSRQRQRVPAFAWLPAALLGAGILLGLVLWSKWGFAIAFEAIRAYCF